MGDVFSEVASSAPASLVALLGAVKISLDIAIVLGVVGALFFYAVVAGKKAMITTLLSLIVTGFFYLMFPYWSILAAAASSEGGPYSGLPMKVGVFVALFLGIRFSLSAVLRNAYPDEDSKKWLAAFSLAFVGAGLLFVYAYQFTALLEVYALPSFVMPFITAPPALFWWLVGAVFAVYIFSD